MVDQLPDGQSYVAAAPLSAEPNAQELLQDELLSSHLVSRFCTSLLTAVAEAARSVGVSSALSVTAVPVLNTRHGSLTITWGVKGAEPPSVSPPKARRGRRPAAQTGVPPS